MKKHHNRGFIRIMGILHLSGISLRELSASFSIPYRTMKYHSQKTGFYIEDYRKMKTNRGAVVIERSKPYVANRRVQLINNKLVTSYIVNG